MIKLLKYGSLVFASALCLGTVSYGFPGFGFGPPPPPPPPPTHKSPSVAPEIDPSLALSALTLIGGMLVVQRSRRSK